MLASLLHRNELNDHLDTIDSNLDNLQTMLTTHGFSVDTSALLDVSTARGGRGTRGLQPGASPARPAAPAFPALTVLSSGSCSAPP